MHFCSDESKAELILYKSFFYYLFCNPISDVKAIKKPGIHIRLNSFVQYKSEYRFVRAENEIQLSSNESGRMSWRVCLVGGICDPGSPRCVRTALVRETTQDIQCTVTDPVSQNLMKRELESGIHTRDSGRCFSMSLDSKARYRDNYTIVQCGGGSRYGLYEMKTIGLWVECTRYIPIVMDSMFVFTKRWWDILRFIRFSQLYYYNFVVNCRSVLHSRVKGLESG